VGLAHSGRPLQEDIGPLAHEGAGGQGLDLTAIQPRLEAVVEVAQGHVHRQVGELQAGADAPRFALGRFQFEDRAEQFVAGAVAFDRLGVGLLEGEGGVGQAQDGELLAHPVDLQGGAFCAHEATSISF
jgi:hypothetical protein